MPYFSDKIEFFRIPDNRIREYLEPGSEFLSFPEECRIIRKKNPILEVWDGT